MQQRLVVCAVLMLSLILPVATPSEGIIPEPGTMTLVGMGALGALGMVRRRRGTAK